MTQTTDDPTVLIIGSPGAERRRGRPPADEPRTVSLHIRLTERQFDQIACFCLRQDVPIAEFVRRVLATQWDSRL